MARGWRREERERARTLDRNVRLSLSLQPRAVQVAGVWPVAGGALDRNVRLIAQQAAGWVVIRALVLPHGRFPQPVALALGAAILKGRVHLTQERERRTVR